MKLQDELDKVTESFASQAPAAVMKAMANGQDELARTGLIDSALKVGDHCPDFSLPDATGNLVTSRDLLARGPMLLTFYRGEWCPYCNLALKALGDVEPGLSRAGAQLVAISPQTPDHSLSIREKHGLPFPVLSDAGNAVSRAFGLVYRLSAELILTYQSLGVDLTGYNGDDSYELPVPANFLIGRDGSVLERHVDIDYRHRLEPVEAIEWANRHQVR